MARQHKTRCRNALFIGRYSGLLVWIPVCSPQRIHPFFGKLAELSDNGIDIHWFIGNHDIWIFDYLPHELGITIHDGTLITEIGGKRFFLSHGDNVGKEPWHFASSEKYFETASANIFTQPYTPGGPLLLHCDGRPIVEKPEMTTPNIKARKTSTWYALPKNLEKRIKSIFIFGHRHILLDLALPHQSRIIILGDWIKHPSYAVFDETGLNLFDYIEE